MNIGSSNVKSKSLGKPRNSFFLFSLMDLGSIKILNKFSFECRTNSAEEVVAYVM
jgi:hypothetical protein